MVFIGNLLWFVFGSGLLLGLSWTFFGILWCMTIVGIPIGIACFRIASFSFFPFGKELVPAEYVGEQPMPGSMAMNVLWFVFSGFWLALEHLSLGLVDCCSIVGIPFGLANFKIAMVALAPLGKRIVTSEVAQKIRDRQKV